MKWPHLRYRSIPVMKKWWFKCAAQLILSHIPAGDRINRLLCEEKLCSHFDEWALKQAVRHIEMLDQAHLNIKNETVLEIGPGWTPINAYIFRIAGCQKVLVCDIYRHINRKLLAVTIKQLRENDQIISELLKIDKSYIDEVLPQVSDQNFETLLEESGFEYKVPFNFKRTDLPSASIGIVTSRATLEHIPPQDLREIFQEMRRIIKPPGVMVHTIDHSDHWEHFDHSISRINFLKFPDWWWNIIGGNNLVYQNRLRSYEYIDMIRDAGFRILYLDARHRKQALADARQMKLIKRYRDLDPAEISILTTHLVAQPS